MLCVIWEIDEVLDLDDLRQEAVDAALAQEGRPGRIYMYMYGHTYIYIYIYIYIERERDR